MKVFLSYGHDANAPLIARISSDLETAGHEVWIDTSQIKVGDDWRRRIADGLADTEWVLGFLSQHSVRDPGVCLDELAIALHTKGGNIATVLVEAEAVVRAPLSVSHIQWLDMHDWAEREAGDKEEWEAWYQEKFGQILTLLADPAIQRFAGEIRALEGCLKPVDQQGDIGALVQGFVGREWLLGQLDRWRTTETSSRLLWLSGAAGTGKSAFSAWLGHHGKVNVIGLNLCAYNKDDRRDAGRILRTLAFQMATRIADYRRILLDRLVRQDADGTEIARKSPAALFAWLLVEPLSLAIDGGRGANRFLMVIDGLDETVREGHSDLAEVLAEGASKLPAWLAVVVTSRPEEPILRQFAGLEPVLLEASSSENIADLKAYVADWLRDAPAGGSEREALIDRIVAASGGNFLYVRMLREGVTGGTLTLHQPESLPKGLIGLYGRWFRHRYPRSNEYERYVPLLSVLVAAEHPVPEESLASLFGWSRRQRAQMLEGLGSLFERRPEGVVPFHKSLRDWLADPKAAGAQFVVEVEDGAALLFDYLWGVFETWAYDGEGRLDAFCIAELPKQTLGRAPKAIAKRITPALIPQLLPALVKVAMERESDLAWQSALAWHQTVVLLTGIAGESENPLQANALRAIGDINRMLGNTSVADVAYDQALNALERIAAADPENADLQHDLAFALANVATLKRQMGNAAEAAQAQLRCLEIRRRISESDLSKVTWSSALASAHADMGAVFFDMGEIEGAMGSYGRSLKLRMDLARADPDNAEWQVEMGRLRMRIGDIEIARGKTENGLENHYAAGKIMQRLVDALPDDLTLQRDLSACYERIGHGEQAAGNTDLAMRFYRAALALIGALARYDRANVGWQLDLAKLFSTIGMLQEFQRDLDGALYSQCQAFEIAERLAEADPQNEDCQLTLRRIWMARGDALLERGDLATAAEAYENGLAISRWSARLSLLNEAAPHDIAVALVKLSKAQVAMCDGVGAIASCQESLHIMRGLVQMNPTHVNLQQTFFSSCVQLAAILKAKKDLEGVLAVFRELAWICEKSIETMPDRLAPQRDLATSRRFIGDVLSGLGDVDAALGQYRQAIAILGDIAAREPDKWKDAHSLCQIYNGIGQALLTQGDSEGALQSCESSLAIARRHTALYPGIEELQADLLATYDTMGRVQIARGDHAAALRVYNDKRDAAHQFSEAVYGTGIWISEMASAYGKIGDLQLASGEPDAAILSYSSRLQLLNLSEAPYRNIFSDMLPDYEKLGDLQLSRRDYDGAVKSFRVAVRLATCQAQENSDSIASREMLCRILEKLGEAYESEESHDHALEMYQQCCAIREQLAAADGVPQSRYADVAQSYLTIALLQHTRCEFAEAISLYKSSLRIREILLEKASGDRALRFDIWKSLIGLAWSLLAARKLVEGREVAVRGRELMVSMLDEEPTWEQGRQCLAYSDKQIADLNRTTGEN